MHRQVTDDLHDPSCSGASQGNVEGGNEFSMKTFMQSLFGAREALFEDYGPLLKVVPKEKQRRGNVQVGGPS
jgi:hypothetical protein